MSVQKRQQSIVSKIHTVQDENVLKMLEAEINYLLRESKGDVTDILDEREFQELKEIALEDPNANTVPDAELKEIREKWRTGLL